MDQLQSLRVYVAVAEEAGFAAASRRLQMSPPAVTRAVAALESHLGVKLLNRTTRNVRVTEAGSRYLEDARQVLARLAAADEAAQGVNAQPRGRLALTAPVLFGQRFVMPGVVDYLERYPDTSVDALFLDRRVNLVEEGIDVGVRIGELPDSSMRALRVGSVRMLVLASPAYLNNHGEPQHPQDLREHCLIASRAGDFSLAWRFNPALVEHPLRIEPRLSATTNDAVLGAATQGFGIARVLSYQAAAQLANGELQVVLSEYEPAPLPVHIVHREERFAATRVRAFIDLLAERLRAEPALGGSSPSG
ncbi:MAG: LysR family transcriptional regulator [Pseudomonadota bacterium]